MNGNNFNKFGGLLILIRSFFIFILIGNIFLTFMGISAIFNAGVFLKLKTNILLYTSLINVICSFVIIKKINVPVKNNRKIIINAIVIIFITALVNGFNHYMKDVSGDANVEIFASLLFTFFITVIFVIYFSKSKRVTAFYTK